MAILSRILILRIGHLRHLNCSHCYVFCLLYSHRYLLTYRSFTWRISCAISYSLASRPLSTIRSTNSRISSSSSGGQVSTSSMSWHCVQRNSNSSLASCGSAPLSSLRASSTARRAWSVACCCWRFNWAVFCKVGDMAIKSAVTLHWSSSSIGATKAERLAMRSTVEHQLSGVRGELVAMLGDRFTRDQ